MESLDRLFSDLPRPHDENILGDSFRKERVAYALNRFLQAEKEEPTNDPLSICMWRLAKQLDAYNGDDIEHSLKLCLAPFALQQAPKSVTSNSTPTERYLAFLKWIILGRRDGERPDLRSRPRRSSGSGQDQCSYLYEHFTNHRQCAKCSTRAASLKCNKCLIEENGYPIVVTFYCSVGCQAAHWCYHREVCQQLKRFYRAACVIRDLFTTLAEATYINGPIDRISMDDGLVHIVQDGKFDRILRGDSMIVPFEWNRFETSDHALAALYDIHGPHQTQATSAGRAFLKMFILTLGVKVREVHFRPKNASFGYANTVPLTVGRGYPPVYNMLETHGVFVVTLKTGHEIVIDVTGSQFGWREVMALWGDYKQVRCHEVTHETLHIGNTCRRFRRAEGPYSPLAAVRQLRRTLMTKIVNEVMSWVMENHTSFLRFTRQPDATYQEAHDTIIAIAKDTCDKELAINHGLGLFRFFRLFNGGVKVTRTWDDADELENVWLTDDELGQADGESPPVRAMRLIDLYERKVKDYYDVTGADVQDPLRRRSVFVEDDNQQEGLPLASSENELILPAPELEERG